ncbi:hypothetical protein ACTFIZ_005084 [Dictyostelium cf. discoideum]
MPSIKSNKSTASALETTSKTTKVVSTGLPLVNKEKAIEAINSLNKYFEQKQLTEPLNILEENKKIYITFETDKYYHNSLFKPHHIVAPYKIGELSEKRTLVIIEGGKVDAINLKTKLVDLGYTGAVDVLSMKEFKNEYVTKEQIIKVRKTYDEFVVDNFYKQKIQHKFGKEFQNSPQSPKLSIIDQKNPVELIETLNKLDRMVLVRRFTELFFTLPVGKSDLPIEQLIENVAFIVGEVSNKLPEKINSIQSLSITGSDISLPFYVNVKVPSNLLFNSKENKVELNPLAIQQENNNNNNNNNNTSEESSTNTTTTITTNTKSNKKRTEPESEEKEQEPIKEKPNKKSKTTPVKEVKSTPAVAAVVAKPTTPVKEVKETPIKSKTPVKESTPAVVVAAAKPTTPAKQVKETPIKSKTPVKESTPQETTTPPKPTKTPTKATTTAAPKEVEPTPAKQVKETPVKQVKETPVKKVKETPVKQVKETPVKQVKETPVKQVKETPVKEVAAPVKETPVKQVKETPVKQVKETPVKQVKETPVKEVAAPVKEVAAPVAKKVTKKAAAAPVEVAPVKEVAAPVEAAPVKKVIKKAAAAAPVEEAPVKKVVKKTATTTATASKLKKPIEKK